MPSRSIHWLTTRSDRRTALSHMERAFTVPSRKLSLCTAGPTFVLNEPSHHFILWISRFSICLWAGLLNSMVLISNQPYFTLLTLGKKFLPADPTLKPPKEKTSLDLCSPPPPPACLKWYCVTDGYWSTCMCVCRCVLCVCVCVQAYLCVSSTGFNTNAGRLAVSPPASRNVAGLASVPTWY